MSGSKLVWWYVLLIVCLVLVVAFINLEMKFRGRMLGPWTLLPILALVALLFLRVAAALKSPKLLKIGSSAILAALIGIITWEIVEEFSENRPIDYYSEDPSRLLLPLGLMGALGVAGLLLMGFWPKVPPRIKKKLYIVGWGTLNVLGVIVLSGAGYLGLKAIPKLFSEREKVPWEWEYTDPGWSMWVLFLFVYLTGVFFLVHSWRAFIRYLCKQQDSSGEGS